MIYRWAVQIGLPQAEAADLVQDIFAALIDKIADFEYDHKRSFRKWLKTVTTNRAKDFLRRRAIRPVNASSQAERLTVPDEIEFLSNREYNQKLIARALEFVQTEFEETTWKACWCTVVDGKSVAETAEQLGVTENSIYIARSRVLRRIRSELSGLLDP